MLINFFSNIVHAKSPKRLFVYYAVLTLILISFQLFFITSVSAFQIGDRVQTTDNLNVRNCPFIACNSIGVIPAGGAGKIINGSYPGDSYTWWYIGWDNGLTGYSVQNWLTVIPGTLPASFTLNQPSAFCNSTNPQIDLSWGSSSGATSYNVYRNGAFYANAFTSLTYNNTSVISGTTYTYFIRASNSAGYLDSNTVAVTAPNCITSPQITIGPSSLNFGSVQAGSCSSAQFAIQHVLNTGTASGNVTINQNDPFKITSNSSFSLSNGQAANVNVEFCPSNSGSFSRAAVISSNANQNINSVNLSGTGFIPSPTTGVIQVNATLDGTPWSGSVIYSISGAQNFSGNTAPADFQDRPQGSYTLAYVSGGPANSTFANITPSSFLTLNEGGIITFTLNFNDLPASKTWYQDTDFDGYGNPNQTMKESSQPYGYVSDNTDCNDNDSTIYPGATEIADDGIDQDCDGIDLPLFQNWYPDNDGDGYGNSSQSISASTQPYGYVSDNTDCDDADATVNPGKKNCKISPIGNTALVFPVLGLPGDSLCPSDSNELSMQNSLNRSWYSVVWSGKYDGNWKSRCKGSGGHPGVDIRIPSGTEIRAIGPGMIYKSYDSSTWGGLIVIKHDNIDGTSGPIWSIYAHLKTRNVQSNQKILSAGTLIGLSGGALNDPNHGTSTGPHLHFQIDKGDNFLTPYWPSGTETYTQDLSVNTYDPIAFIESHQQTLSVPTWYEDSDGDGYGNSNQVMSASSQPTGYVSDNTDCNDTDSNIYPGAAEITGDGIDQDCDGSDLAGSTGVDQISLLSPANNDTQSFGASGGKITFYFSKVANVAKYILHFELNDIINQTTSSVPVELIPPNTSSGLPWGGTAISTPGFSEQFIGMAYELSLDTSTWDVLSLYDIKWGVEAYDSPGSLIGSSYKSSVPSKYASNIKFLASTAIALTSPPPGTALILSDSAPVFKWDLYSGVSAYELILARVDGASFFPVLPFPNLTLNLLTMDNSTWQSMPTGAWYWTVLGYDSMGNQMPPKFTIFDFEVQ